MYVSKKSEKKTPQSRETPSERGIPPKTGKTFVCDLVQIQQRISKKRKNKPTLRYKRGGTDLMVTKRVSKSFGKLEVKIVTYEKVIKGNTHFGA